MVIEFECVNPIGHRTCADLPAKTGGIQHQWLDSDVPEFVTEAAALQRGDLDQKLARRHHLDAVGKLTSLKRRAARGQLPVGRTANFPARVLTIVPYILELRPGLSKGPTQPRIFRLYYAEPKAADGTLLPLVLSTKPASDDTSEQNQSILDAKARSRAWTLYKVIGGKS